MTIKHVTTIQPAAKYPENFTHSGQYWDERYRLNGHSGADFYLFKYHR